MGLFSNDVEAPDLSDAKRLTGKGIGELQSARKYAHRQLGAANRRMKPYTSGGASAQNQLMAQLGLSEGPAFDVTQLAGYQQALDKGIGAVNQGGAGAGMLMSGERLKGLQNAGQQVFGNYYQDYMNRLTGMAGRGQQAGMGLGQLGQQAAGTFLGASQGMANTYSQMGQLSAQQAAADAAAENASGTNWGDILGTAGTIGGMMMGGPLGGSIGGSVGQAVGGGGDFNAGFGGAGGGMDALSGGGGYKPFMSGGF